MDETYVPSQLRQGPYQKEPAFLQVGQTLSEFALVLALNLREFR